MEEVETLRQALSKHLPWHGARLAFLAQFLLALFKVRTVNLAELATAFRGKAKVASHYKRLQRFFRGFDIDQDALARLLVELSGQSSGPWILSLDRTNWKLGKTEINFLVLGIVHEGVALPVMWQVLNKAGNSHTDERIALLERFLACFGAERIQALVADREFIGEKWFQWLQAHHIPFAIRLKDNTLIPNGEVPIPAKSYVQALQPGQSLHLPGPRLVWGCPVDISALATAKDERLILASSGIPQHEALAVYRRRWHIETLFGALKSRGFRLEDTHLTHPERLSKLFALLTLAFAWSLHTGERLAQQKPIQEKKPSSVGSSPSSAMASISFAMSSLTSMTNGRTSFGC